MNIDDMKNNTMIINFNINKRVIRKIKSIKNKRCVKSKVIMCKTNSVWSCKSTPIEDMERVFNE